MPSFNEMEPPARISILTYTTLYPNAAQPNHGIFVENRLRHLVQTAPVTARVMAPIPWFPFSDKRFGDYAKFAQAPRHETRSGLALDHPRYLVIPKVGMSLAPAALYAASLPHLRRLQRQAEFDLIDAHYLYPDGVAAIWLGHALGKPVVLTARGTDVNFIPKYALPRRMIRAAAAAADGLIAVSEAIKDAMVSLGIPASAVTVLRNGVDLALFHPQGRSEARARLALGGNILLSVGHLIERKGHDLILRAMPDLPDFRLLIAGEGPDRAALEALAIGLGIAQRVTFLGGVEHWQMQSIYAAADALVLASSREGWPNVLLEAMACGTPVVASNVWGNPEVVAAPAAGVLMDERSPAGIAGAVRRLFANLPGRADTRGLAEQFSWDATSMGQMSLFRRILADRRSASAPA